MRARSKLSWWVLGVIVLAVAGLLVLRAQRKPDAVPARAPVLEVAPVDVVTVQAAALTRGVQLSGLLQPLRQALLTADVEGRVDEVRVRAGERVAAGQVIARMDVRDLASRVAQQKANLAVSRAQLDLADKTFSRNQELLARNFISATTLDNSRSTLDAARETLKANEAQLALAVQALDKATIRAPIAGVVAERSIEVGQHVGLNTRMFSIVDLSTLEFAANVPVNVVGAVRVGQDVSLHVEGIAETVTGKVERISPVADQGSRMIPVFIDVPNPDARLKGGMVAQGRVTVVDTGPSLVLSDQALRHAGTQDYVLRVAEGRVERCPVVIGARDEEGGRVEVKSGLAAGDRVLLARVDVAPGAAVKLVAP